MKGRIRRVLAGESDLVVRERTVLRRVDDVVAAAVSAAHTASTSSLPFAPHVAASSSHPPPTDVGDAFLDRPGVVREIRLRSDFDRVMAADNVTGLLRCVHFRPSADPTTPVMDSAFARCAARHPAAACYRAAAERVALSDCFPRATSGLFVFVRDGAVGAVPHVLYPVPAMHTFEQALALVHK